MEEEEIKQMWQLSTTPPIELRLKPDLDKFENRYRYLLRNTSLLYERNFQIGLFIFLTAINISWFFEARQWYSYVLCIIVLISWWYIFYLTDKVRAAVKAVPQDAPILIQMQLRRNVLDRLSILRMHSLGAAVFMFLLIWSLRSPERRHEGSLIFGFVAMFVMALAAVIVSKRKLGSTRTYLENIIKVLEEEK